MSDKKLPKIKHNHTLTDILKASIFSLVMMAPVTAIGVTCAYVVCNKNAYQSYYGETINDRINTLINNKNNFELNNTYTFNSNNKDLSNVPTNTGAYANVINVSNVKILETNLTGLIEFNRFALYVDNTSTLSISLANNDTQVIKYFTNSNYLIFSFDYEGNNLSFDFTQINVFYKTTYNKDSYLDNVFYYAVDTMQNNTLFSWTKTTAIYTPVNAMTTGMGITTPAIAVLLVYWLLCTAVYIIIDIVVKGFTWLTHLIGER